MFLGCEGLQGSKDFQCIQMTWARAWTFSKETERIRDHSTVPKVACSPGISFIYRDLAHMVGGVQRECQQNEAGDGDAPQGTQQLRSRGAPSLAQLAGSPNPSLRRWSREPPGGVWLCA